MKEPSRTFVRVAGLSLVLLAVLLSRASRVCAQIPHLQDSFFDRIVTQTAYSQLPVCNAPNCVPLAEGGQAYVSDYSVVHGVTISAAHDQEVFKWQALRPDNATVVLATLTFTQATQCFTWSTGSSLCGQNYIKAWTGPLVTCGQTGLWTLQFLDDGNSVYSHQFNLSHNSSGPIVINSLTDKELIDLNQQTYTATNPVPFIATTSGGGTINWTAALSYNTSKGFGYFTHNRTFTTAASGQEHDETYQSEGGRVCATAQTTLSDGSTVQDNVTFYVEGTQTFDPTSQLVSLYASGATPRLMTGIAQHESTYYQFFSQNLLNATALWPRESSDGGSHIGLMMVPITEALAWDWMQNTNDGVNSTDHGYVAAKLPLAQSFVNWMTGAISNKNVPVHNGLQGFSSPSVQLENMALVLYRGNANAAGWAGQYYIPVCPPPGMIKASGNTWTCNGGSWYWAVNDPNINDPGADQNVQAKYIFASGTGTFGNRAGLQYVTNGASDPWYDPNIQGGARNEMH